MKIRNNKSRVLTMLRLIHKPKLAKIYRLYGRNKMFSGMLFFWSDYKFIKTKLLDLPSEYVSLNYSIPFKLSP